MDRKSNMIISGGENNYPSEVEYVLGPHPKVKDIAVIGVPDEVWSESVRAVLVAHDGQRIGEAELVDWSRTRIARYKRPRSTACTREEDTSRTATGKIQERVPWERSGKDHPQLMALSGAPSEIGLAPSALGTRR